MKKRFGFTLAEVLITVGVLGVVAALTLPNIKLAYSKKVTLAQLQKTYSYMANTIEMSEYHNGKVKRWDLDMPAKDFFEKYFKNYMKYALEMSSSQLELPEGERKFINGSKVTGEASDAVYKTYKKDSPENQQGYHIIMMDGSMISLYKIRATEGSSIKFDAFVIVIDTNGESSPNTLGKDIFVFTLSKNAGFIPVGECANGRAPMGSGVSGISRTCTGGANPTPNNARKMYNGTSSMTSPTYSCNSEYKGYWCAALIKLDGWKMEKYYPWGKH